MSPSIDIAETLWRAHNDPSGGHEQALSSADLSALTVPQGQQIQLALLQRWLDQGETLGGWKIGMTSGANRNAMGDNIRPFGFILSNRIKTATDRLSVSRLHRGQIENELCFLIKEPLGSGATATQAAACVAAVLPAFEINQKRLPADSPAALRVGDNLSNWGICVGEPVAPPATLSDLTVSLSGEQGLIEQISSEGHIDEHYDSIAVLANTLSTYGYRLEPGQYVITGAYGKTPFVPGTYVGDFDQGIGRVHVHLDA